MNQNENYSCETCTIKSCAVETLGFSELQILERNFGVRHFKKNETIFQQGSLTSNIAYIKHGLVKIHKKGPVKDQILKLIKPLCFIGIPTILGDRLYQYSATAIENTSVCFIDTDVFRKLILENGKFGNEIIKELCQDELLFFERSINQMQKQIHGRLADALLFLANDIFQSEVFIMPLSRSELGDFIHSTRESVTRCLTSFKKDGLIEINGKQFTLLDKAALIRVSKTG
ncbi:MAG: Crp/Fnr family transcriptional regulator [Bacteroidales bacterium]|nr:Crp/Fnr family transcriptional regulator [Bacteroidales bacterium]MDP2237952.1 Crp/Fnr family transcriptional regulator [Bacteroidales bacterium]